MMEYIVKGINRETKEDVSISIKAATKESAIKLCKDIQVISIAEHNPNAVPLPPTPRPPQQKKLSEKEDFQKRCLDMISFFENMHGIANIITLVANLGLFIATVYFMSINTAAGTTMLVLALCSLLFWPLNIMWFVSIDLVLRFMLLKSR